MLYAFERLGVTQKSVVLDPFLGVGSTCLTCREMGISSIGVEISPLFKFVAEVKCRRYDPEKLRSMRDEIFAYRFKPLNVKVSPQLRQLYPKPVLEDIAFFKEVIARIGDPVCRDFFTLGLMKAAEMSSYIYRDGAVVKAVKDRVRIPSLRKAFRRTVNMMIKDVVRCPLTDAWLEIRLGDARYMDFIEDNSIDAVITSPPYLNKIEYTKVYWPEYELFFPEDRPAGLRSYIGVRPGDVDYSQISGDMPVAAHLYFEDVEKALSEVYRVLVDGGRAALVVGGGVFPDRVVNVDFEVAKLAEKIGFTVDEIIAVAKRAATTRRVVKIGETRESILFLTK